MQTKGALHRTREDFMSNKVSIRTVTDFVNAIEQKWNSWGKAHPVWFRGESDWGRDEHAQKGHVVPLPLCPRIHAHNSRQKNYLLQTFRRKAGGFANMPPSCSRSSFQASITPVSRSLSLTSHRRISFKRRNTSRNFVSPPSNFCFGSSWSVYRRHIVWNVHEEKRRNLP